MRIKNIGYFVITSILGLVITITLSSLANQDSHERDILIIKFFEVKTFLSIGLLWYAPLLLFINNSIANKRIYRLLIYLNSMLICIIYYRILTYTYNYIQPDDRLHVGYLYEYKYYLDVGMGVFLSLILMGIIMEILVRRNNKLIKEQSL